MDWPRGAPTAKTPGFSEDRFIKGLEALTTRVHSQGAKIIAQLNHAGKTAQHDVESGRPMLVPSIPKKLSGDLMKAITRPELANFVGSQGPDGKGPQYQVVSQADIDTVLDSFAKAAKRAKQAGAAAV